MTISPDEMLPPMLAACHTFKPLFDKLEADGAGIFIVLAELGSHIWMLLREQKGDIERIFAVIEKWQVDGDAEVKQLVEIGLMERLKHAKGPHDSETRKKLLAALGQASRGAWDAA